MTHQCIQEDKIKTLSIKCDNHVTWTVYWSIMLVFFGLTVSSLGFLYTGISANLAKIEVNKDELLSKQTDQAIISTRIETQLQRIQLDLTEININIKKIK